MARPKDKKGAKFTSFWLGGWSVARPEEGKVEKITTLFFNAINRKGCNLHPFIRNELTVLERAEQLRRRKEIYEAKYPESKRPQGGRRPKNSEIVSPFSEDTASKVGISPRTVQHEVQIAEDLAE